LLREMLVRAGDAADPQRIELSRQAVMDLGLFKSVDARLEPGLDGVVLTMTVDEKRYFFVLPALGRSGDGDWSYGVQMKLDNVGGRDHRLEAELQRREFASGSDIEDQERLSLSYRYPRIRGGPWQLDSDLRFRTAFLEEERDRLLGSYESRTRRLQLLASRWRRRVGPSLGWRWGAGVEYEDFDFEYESGAPNLFFDTTEVGMLGRVAYRNVHSYEYSRSGREFGYSLNLFTEALGSAKDRLVHSVFYREYHPITQRPHTNINIQMRWSLTSESLFGDPTFSLGGSSRLRGYEHQAIEGDAFILANLELLTPIFGEDSLRLAVFLDVGDAFRDRGHFTLSDIKSGGGVGLRWHLRSFVNVDLRLDFARGFDESAGGESKVYAGTDATF
jgi:outer membrane protein assembly factor BamA